MKKMKWLCLCLALLLLAGCAAEKPQETEKENWQMNTELIEMMKTAANCTESRAKAMLEVFREVGMAEPVSAELAEAGKLTVKTADGGKYEVCINKKNYVYSVKDLVADAYLYRVVE